MTTTYPSREEVARLIDYRAFYSDDTHGPSKATAFSKADAILALFPSPAPLDDGVRERVEADLRTIEDGAHNALPIRVGWDTVNTQSVRYLGDLCKDLRTLLPAVQGAGEPVAYRTRLYEGGEWLYLPAGKLNIERFRATFPEYETEPLYAHPAPDQTASLKARVEELEGLARALADATDTVGIAYFDTDDMEPEVEAMQAATLALRAALQSDTPAGGA